MPVSPAPCPSVRPHYPSSPTPIGDLPPRHSGPRSGTQGTGAATTTTIIPHQHPPTVLPHPDAVPTVGPGRRTRPHHSHVTTTTNPLSPPPSSPTLARHPRPRSGTFPRVIPDPDPEPRGRARQPPLPSSLTNTPQPSYRTPMRYPRWGPGGAHARTTHTSLPSQPAISTYTCHHPHRHPPKH